MEKNNFDIFESKSQKQTVQENSNNFFLNDDFITDKSISEPSRRLNDYDSNLLKEDAYKDVSDDVFKLEYRISKTEEDIKNLNAQIQVAEEIQDYETAGELKGRLILLEEDREALIAMYNDKSLSAKISDSILSILGNNFKNKINSLKNKFSGFSQTVTSKLPAKIARFIEIRKSLNKLENINKSVDELVKLNIPYGENIDKYTQLSKYIIKANSIQAEISAYMKK